MHAGPDARAQPHVKQIMLLSAQSLQRVCCMSMASQQQVSSC